DHIKRGVGSKLPAHPDVRLRADVAGATLHEAAVADDGPGDAGDTSVGVHLLSRPGRADRGVEGQGRGQAVRRPQGDRHAAVPVVADVRVHTTVVQAGTEVRVAEGQEGAPRRVVPGIRVQRLEVPLALRDAVTGLVTRAVHAAALEEQRTGRPAADHVEQVGLDVAIDLLPAPGAGAGVGERVHAAELVVEGGIETEGAEPPARIGTDRVPGLVHR